MGDREQGWSRGAWGVRGAEAEVDGKEAEAKRREADR